MSSPVDIRSRGWLWATLATVAFSAALGLRLLQLRSDPDVYLLAADEGAEWIRVDMPFELNTYGTRQTGAMFATSFDLLEPLDGAELTLRAFRRCEVELDGQTIYKDGESLADWQRLRVVKLPGPLAAGYHRLQILVFNDGAHACLWARSEPLGIRTGPDWLTSLDRGQFAPARSVETRVVPPLALMFPRARDAFVHLGPGLGLIFLAALVGWGIACGSPTGEIRLRGWRCGAAGVRWVLLAAWTLLAINNIWQVDPRVGYDVQGHFEYVRFLTQNGRLPLATDGWQMFQSPLFYLLAAPCDALLAHRWTDAEVTKALRFLPLLCGLAQIEICFRAARTVFTRDDQQAIATVIGGLMPMQIYISQVIGNEPLAGALTSLLVLLCLQLLCAPGQPRRGGYFALMGGVWGLALLAKVTPVLLAPLVFATAWFCLRTQVASLPAHLWRIACLLAGVIAIAGWYYARNWWHLGTPFVGGWEAATGKVWWQDPSYRTWSQLASFGPALDRPVYSGVWSLWDALYSTMWLDGYTSGLVGQPQFIPWQLDWMAIGAWLGLVPLGLLIGGAVFGWRAAPPAARPAVVFCLAAIAIYLAAVTDLFLRLPIYSTAKATYTLGILPCYALVAAAGATPLLRWRWTRAAILAAITCCGTAAYLAYWVR
ncbi:MAG: hypothetical protein JNG90_06395 [Planctomycetaceae bacterium]|nr:hypothetical protein [Planctomycetaceae bacterium]